MTAHTGAGGLLVHPEFRPKWNRTEIKLPCEKTKKSESLKRKVTKEAAHGYTATPAQWLFAHRSLL